MRKDRNCPIISKVPVLIGYTRGGPNRPGDFRKSSAYVRGVVLSESLLAEEKTLPGQ